MKDAKLGISIYNHTFKSFVAEIRLKFGCNNWTIKNESYFGSTKAAENQARKIAKKLGLNIVETTTEKEFIWR